MQAVAGVPPEATDPERPATLAAAWSERIIGPLEVRGRQG